MSDEIKTIVRHIIRAEDYTTTHESEDALYIKILNILNILAETGRLKLIGEMNE